MRQGSRYRFDIPFLAVTLALIAIGEVMIYSAYEVSNPAGTKPFLENTLFRQALFAAIGLVIYFAATMIHYRVVLLLWRWIYLFVLAVLAVTLLIGGVSFGAQSWLELPVFGVQPSELCKVLMIVVLTRFLGIGQRELEGIRPLLYSIVLLVPPVVLIYLQPDFGTAVVLSATWLGMVFLAGVRWKHMLLFGLAGALVAPIIWRRLEGYMRDRVLLFLFPGNDPSGASYNVTQALISIGSGGFWGKGLFQGTQSQLHFLRVRHTDFIFSVLAEELGFLGAVMLLCLLAFLVLRLLRIASQARDAQGRLLAGGVACMLLAQSVIHLGMNANLLPVTGLPLPLVSYGGSSLLTTLLGLGLAQNVAMRSTDGDRQLV